MKTARSEDDILALLTRRFPEQHPALSLGRGDDCAVIKAGRPLAMTSDMFVEDVHFRRSYFTAEDVGHKALAVNISDLAACGARPLAFQLCLGLPEDVDTEWLNGCFAGMAVLANRYGMGLSGGDLSRSSRLCIAITAWGEASDPGAFLTRGGSMPGDVLFVVGRLGLARVGLLALEAEGRAALDHWPDACEAHLRPTPLVDAGLMLSRAGFNARPPALMDVSDGILRDLPRLLGQGAPDLRQPVGAHAGFGAEIVLARGQLHPEVVRHAALRGRDPVRESLIGGEDYALLGSCAPDMLPALNAAIPRLTCIGTVTGERGIVCNNEMIDASALACAFDHFS